MTLLVGVLTLGHYVNNSFLIMATLIAIMGITFVIPTESYLLNAFPFDMERSDESVGEFNLMVYDYSNYIYYSILNESWKE